MDIYQALADSNRRKIIELIALRGELSATEIYDKFDVTAPAISQHLKVLRDAKILEMEKQAQRRIYRINADSIQEVDRWVQKLKKYWNKRFERLDKVLKQLK